MSTTATEPADLVIVGGTIVPCTGSSPFDATIVVKDGTVLDLAQRTVGR